MRKFLHCSRDPVIRSWLPVLPAFPPKSSWSTPPLSSPTTTHLCCRMPFPPKRGRVHRSCHFTLVKATPGWLCFFPPFPWYFSPSLTGLYPVDFSTIRVRVSTRGCFQGARSVNPVMRPLSVHPPPFSSFPRSWFPASCFVEPPPDTPGNNRGSFVVFPLPWLKKSFFLTNHDPRVSA